MKLKTIFILNTLLLLQMEVWAQHGSLFIIGGGDRPPSLMRTMIDAAELSSRDHIVILTMSSADPDTSYYYILQDLQPFCQQVIAKLQFAKGKCPGQNHVGFAPIGKVDFYHRRCTKQIYGCRPEYTDIYCDT
ncbi:MAG: hypothetical protein IPK94_22880 [Saprospiraceae bacterium]|nr:hypothetical protein [Saprospiraceae bacterium]